MNTEPLDQPRPPIPRWAWAAPLTVGYLTSAIVLAGAWVGVDYVPRLWHPNSNAKGFANSLCNWDGVWYASVVREGYSYKPHERTSIAFFPAFPVLGTGVHWATHLSEENSLLLVSLASLLAFFVVFHRYVRIRCLNASEEVADWAVLAFALWPLSFFFRMAYSESLFVLVLVIASYGMERQWPTPIVAVIIGVATACRPMGVALLAPFALHLWERRTATLQFITRAALLLPLAAWGLVAFMTYQYFEFGDAFAFMRVQQNWAVRNGYSTSEYLRAIATLEPLWSKYVSSSPVYWAANEPVKNPLFSLDFMNPLFYMAIAGLVALGSYKRWLNSREIVLAAGLLLIPYLTHAYRAGMMGQGRYAASVFPAYLVLGQLLHRAPPPVAALLLSFSAALMAAYAALFAAWYRFI